MVTLVASQPSKPLVLKNVPLSPSCNKFLWRWNSNLWNQIVYEIYCYENPDLNASFFGTSEYDSRYFALTQINLDNYNLYLATCSGLKSPPPSHIRVVSSGFVACSVSNPGVSVSGGQLTETLIPNGLSSKMRRLKIYGSKYLKCRYSNI